MKRGNFGKWMALFICGAIITGMVPSVVQGAEIISENLFEEQQTDASYCKEGSPAIPSDSDPEES